MPDSAGKICAKCGIDVSGSPRTKDKQGRYWCKQCFERAKAAAAKKKAAAPAVPAQTDVMGQLVDEAVSLLGDPCPQCGNPMGPDALICTNCGHNIETGKGVKTRVETIKQPSKSGAALGSAAKLAAGPTLILMGTVFSVIGGIVGAGVWAYVAYQFNSEIGWIAWGIGFAVGAGMVLGARSQAGLMTGLIAGAIALVAVASGKYAAVQFYVDDITSGKQSITITTLDAKLDLAWDIVERRQLDGQELRWPGGTEPEVVTTLDQFPRPVAAQTENEWTEMTPVEKREYKDAIETQFREAIAAMGDMATEIGFAASFSLFDLVFFGLAVCTAFGLGSGAVDIRGSDD